MRPESGGGSSWETSAVPLGTNGLPHWPCFSASRTSRSTSLDVDFSEDVERDPEQDVLREHEDVDDRDDEEIDSCSKHLH